MAISTPMLVTFLVYIFGMILIGFIAWRSTKNFDDYILGAFLLYGAWRVGKDVKSGQRFLAAGFAFMCGMVYYSFFGQLRDIRMGLADPAPISSTTVAIIKGIGFVLGILGLACSLRKLPETRN